MLYTSGIEIPNLNLFEVIQKAGLGGLTTPTVILIIFFVAGVSLFGFLSLVDKQDRSINVTVMTAWGILLAAPLILMNPSNGKAEMNMLLDHYNVQTRTADPDFPTVHKFTPLYLSVVTEEDGSLTEHRLLYATLSKDGVATISMNTGTDENPIIKPLLK